MTKEEWEILQATIKAVGERDPNKRIAGVLAAAERHKKAKCPICDDVGGHKWNCTLNR